MSYRAKAIGTGRYKVFVEVNARAVTALKLETI